MNDIEQIRKAQIRQGEDIALIKNALLGTEYTNNKGLADAVQQNTLHRRKSGKRAGLIAGFSTGMGFVFGAAWGWIKTHILHI